MIEFSELDVEPDDVAPGRRCREHVDVGNLVQARCGTSNAQYVRVVRKVIRSPEGQVPAA
jgi:hypothetical protein